MQEGLLGVAAAAAKIQQHIGRRASSSYRSNRASSYEAGVERISNARSPRSGIQEAMRTMASEVGDKVSTETTGEKVLPGSLKMTARVIEAWINNTLRDAETLDIPGCISKKEAAFALSKYGVDRPTLRKAGLSTLQVDNIFRALFVYSIGFYNVLNHQLAHIEGKYPILAGIWKVYAILLEYCCQIDYKLTITTLNMENSEEIKRIENEWRDRIDQTLTEKSQLFEVIDTLKKEVAEVERLRNKEAIKREDLEDELSHRGQDHEVEVAMRLQFESKLNSLYAAQRSLEGKLALANQQINEDKVAHDKQTKKVNELRSQLSMALNDRAAIEKANSSMTETIELQRQEARNFENKLNKSIKQIEVLKSSQANTNALHQDDFKFKIEQNLEIEKLRNELQVIKAAHLKVKSSSKQYKRESIQSAEKADQLQSELEAQSKKYSYFEQEFVRIRESDQANVSQLAKYKKKAEELEIEVKRLEESSLKVINDRDAAISDAKISKEQHENDLKQLHEATRGRRVAEEQSTESETTLLKCQEELREKHGDLIKTRKENDQLSLRNCELQNDHILQEKKRTSGEDQYEQHKKNLVDKIQNLNEILLNEKKFREVWVGKYEEEQQAHINTSNDLTEATVQVKELNIQVKSLKNQLRDKTRYLENEQKRNSELYERIVSQDTNAEESNRQLSTLGHLIQVAEETSKKKMEDQAARLQKEIEKRDLKLNSYDVRLEDIWSQGLRMKGHYDELRVVATDAENMVKILNDEVAERDTKISDLYNKNDEKEEDIKYLRENTKELRDSYMEQENLKIEMEARVKKAEQRLNQALSKIPESLQNSENPLAQMKDALDKANEELARIKKIKYSMKAMITQTDQNNSTQETQTELGMTFFERQIVSRSRTPNGGLVETELIRQPFRSMKDSQKRITTSGKNLKLDAYENLPTLGSRNITPEYPERLATRFDFAIPQERRFEQIPAPKQAFEAPLPPKRPRPSTNRTNTSKSNPRNRPVAQSSQNRTFDDVMSSQNTNSYDQRRQNLHTSPDNLNTSQETGTRSGNFTTGIKAFLRQANSRNKDNFNFM